MLELTDRVAVVTGAASGIGRALAERFASERMRVVLADIEEEPLARAASAIEGRGAPVLAVPTDVSSAQQVEALREKTLRTFGAVHLVCNNAGVGGGSGPVWERTLEDWEWTLGVNLWGVIHGIRTFVPTMLGQDTEGHVVNTASLAGLMSLPFGSVYHATKHAVVTISESLHYELQMMGSKVKVSVLCPGFVATNIADSERNRPPHLRNPERPVSEGEKSMEERVRDLIASGMPSEQVAERVLEAIREKRLYVFPDPEPLAAVRSRMEQIVDQRNPTFEFPEAARRLLDL
jgi:NAD(P)-dependent dehydrogenase (short-subunit alcohol dehydrogenase family)